MATARICISFFLLMANVILLKDEELRGTNMKEFISVIEEGQMEAVLLSQSSGAQRKAVQLDGGVEGWRLARALPACHGAGDGRKGRG